MVCVWLWIFIRKKNESVEIFSVLKCLNYWRKRVTLNYFIIAQTHTTTLINEMRTVVSVVAKWVEYYFWVYSCYFIIINTTVTPIRANVCVVCYVSCFRISDDHYLYLGCEYDNSFVEVGFTENGGKMKSWIINVQFFV